VGRHFCHRRLLSSAHNSRTLIITLGLLERELMPDEHPRNSPLDLTGAWQLDAEPVEEIYEVPIVGTDTPAPPASPPLIAQSPDNTPPSPEQIIESMLFVGGHSLVAETACSAIRGLTEDRFHEAIDALTRQYRQQKRPYTIQPRDDGFVLAILPTYRGLREKLFGGPREARLGQPALDVLSVVAYRQPVGKAEVDTIRGTDSGAILRHLVRLGLVAVQHRAEAGTRAVRYGTTQRFLQVFGLSSLEELPRLGDTAQV
jgi:segregation and condensation protein B